MSGQVVRRMLALSEGIILKSSAQFDSSGLDEVLWLCQSYPIFYLKLKPNVSTKITPYILVGRC